MRRYVPIAYSTNRHGGSNFEIYVMAPNGTGQTRLTTNTAVDAQPAWSPDGATILFATNRHPPGNYELYTMSPTGAHQTRITTAADWFPDW
jgi:TolB protein